jgi:hypothetical protein
MLLFQSVVIGVSILASQPTLASTIPGDVRIQERQLITDIITDIIISGGLLTQAGFSTIFSVLNQVIRAPAPTTITGE